MLNNRLIIINLLVALSPINTHAQSNNCAIYQAITEYLASRRTFSPIDTLSQNNDTINRNKIFVFAFTQNAAFSEKGISNFSSLLEDSAVGNLKFVMDTSSVSDCQLTGVPFCKIPFELHPRNKKDLRVALREKRNFKHYTTLKLIYSDVLYDNDSTACAFVRIAYNLTDPFYFYAGFILRQKKGSWAIRKVKFVIT